MVAVLVARRCTASSAAGTAQVAAVAVVGTTAVAAVEVVVAHRRSGTHRSRRPSVGPWPTLLLLAPVVVEGLV